MRGKRPNSANKIVRESITEALFRLMKEKIFSNITVLEIVKLAGVGKSSFYRNFRDKEEVILDYLLDEGEDWWSNHTFSSLEELWKIVFDFFDEMKPKITIIYKADLSWLLFEYLRGIMNPTDTNSNKEIYFKAVITGIFFSVLDIWIKNGRKETPEELASYMIEFGIGKI